MLHLKDNQPGFIDAASAMLAGDNHIVDLVGFGPPDASALVVIADSPQAPAVEGESDLKGHKGKIKKVQHGLGHTGGRKQNRAVRSVGFCENLNSLTGKKLRQKRAVSAQIVTSFLVDELVSSSLLR